MYNDPKKVTEILNGEWIEHEGMNTFVLRIKGGAGKKDYDKWVSKDISKEYGGPGKYYIKWSKDDGKWTIIGLEKVFPSNQATTNNYNRTSVAQSAFNGSVQLAKTMLEQKTLDKESSIEWVLNATEYFLPELIRIIDGKPNKATPKLQESQEPLGV